MKTAMQELMQWMEKNEFMVNKGFIEKLNGCLEKEKEHIIKAHENGQAEFDSLHYRDKNVTLSNNYYN